MTFTCSICCSLHYHYSHAIGRAADAFRFAVTAADNCISQGAYSGGMYYVQHAVELIDSSPVLMTQPSLALLLSVVQSALKGLGAGGFVTFCRSLLEGWQGRRSNMDNESSNWATASNHHDSAKFLVYGFESIKMHLKSKLKEVLKNADATSLAVDQGGDVEEYEFAVDRMKKCSQSTCFCRLLCCSGRAATILAVDT